MRKKPGYISTQGIYLVLREQVLKQHKPHRISQLANFNFPLLRGKHKRGEIYEGEKTSCVSANDMFVSFFARLYKGERREERVFIS